MMIFFLFSCCWSAAALEMTNLRPSSGWGTGEQVRVHAVPILLANQARPVLLVDGVALGDINPSALHNFVPCCLTSGYLGVDLLLPEPLDLKFSRLADKFWIQLSTCHIVSGSDMAILLPDRVGLPERDPDSSPGKC